MALAGTLDELFKTLADEKLKKAISHLKSLAPDFLAGEGPGYAGRTEIEGEEIFALHQIYETKPPKEARFEAHRKHIDIQFIHFGEEAMLTAGIEGVEELVPYDEKTDVAFYGLCAGREITVAAGRAAIFYPADLHAPCLDPSSGRNLVGKTVVKVRI